MTRIRWTTEAADQLDAIVNHIREDNPEAAFALAQAILDRIAGLEKFPGLGRPGERNGTRESRFSALRHRVPAQGRRSRNSSHLAWRFSTRLMRNKLIHYRL